MKTSSMLIEKSKYGSSLKAFHSTIDPIFRGGSLAFIQDEAMTEVARAIKPITRIVQGNPIRGSSACATRGKVMPPVALPVRTRAIAIARCFEKYVVTTARQGQTSIPSAIPTATPCARKICQYSVAKDVIKIPRICTAEPIIKRARK